MNKEVIIVLHTLAIGGAERRLSTVANYMVSKGISVTMLLIDNPVVKFELDSRVKVVCVNQTPDLSEYESEKCELFKLEKEQSVSFTEKVKLFLLKKINKSKYDYIDRAYLIKYKNAIPLHEYIKQHPNATVISFMTIPNISLMMAVKNLPNRALFGDCTLAKTEFSENSPIYRLRKEYYDRADAAVFQTEEQRQFYDFLPNVEKNVIPNFIKADGLPERFDGERRKDIVTFCRISHEKDLKAMVDAFELVHNQFTEYTLSIYGDGYLKGEIQKCINSKNLEKCAHIYDFDINIHQKIRDAAMFVSSSYREGISNSMLEALAIGMPCVCTDCAGGGARMMIDDHENGLLVPMKNPQALYEGMKEIIENPQLAEKMSRNAVKIKERLKPEVICDQMIEAILGEKIQ